MSLEFLQPIAQPLPPPGPNDWLAHNIEPGQTLEEYVQAAQSRPLRSPGIIYLYPFLQATPDSTGLLAAAADFLADYFLLHVRIETLRLSADPRSRANFRPNLGFGLRASCGELIARTHYTRAELDRGERAGGCAHVVLTDYDLWCEEDDLEDWVFGLAQGCHGVVSTARLRSIDLLTGKGFALLMKTLSHEVGHMLHLAHCTAAKCNMNGKNNEEELDRHPIELCPQCLEKLHFFHSFDPLERATRLIATLEGAGVDLSQDYLYRERALIAARPS